MNVLRSQAEPDLTYVLLSRGETAELRRLLKGADSPLAKTLREKLKAVKRGS